jgi:hypothetical protein
VCSSDLYGNGHYYDGLLDDVRFYDWPLSHSDVNLLYAGYHYNNTGSVEISTVVETVKVSFTPDAKNWLGARLLDQRGRLLVGVPLSFTVDSTIVGTGLTGQRGYLWIPYNPTGSYTRTLTVSFNGAESFAGASDTVQLTAAQASPLQQYAIIGAIVAATLGVVTVLVHYTRKMSEDIAESLRETLGESYR